MLQIDPVRPADRASSARWAVDVQPHKRARVHPIRRRRIRNLVTNRVHRRPESCELVVVESSTRVIPCPVQRHARLVRVTKKIQAFQIQFLRAIGR